MTMIQKALITGFSDESKITVVQQEIRAEAELINVPEKYLVSVPEGVDSQQATAVIQDWNTAYGMVMRAARVEPGDKVFVHGLSGGVRHALLTLAKMEGATVYGTASGCKHADLVEARATPYAYSGKEWSAPCRGSVEWMPSLTRLDSRAGMSLTPF